MDQELKGILTQILDRLDRQDAKFDAMDAKFESKLDAMDAKFESKLEAMDAKFESKFEAMDTKWEKKFDMIMSEVAVIKEDLTEVKTSVAGLHKKHDYLRDKVMEHDIAIWQVKKHVG